MRIIQKNYKNIINIYVFEAGEEQHIGSIYVEENGFKAIDPEEASTIKKTKSEAIEWLLVRAGY